MRSRRTTTALLLVGFAAVACSSPEEKLLDRRERLSATLDELYASYTGREGGSSGGAEDTSSSGGVVGRFLAQVDRAQFDAHCLAIGRGERPFSLSGKLDTFMKVKKNARTCRKAAGIQLSVEELEREVARRADQR